MDDNVINYAVRAINKPGQKCGHDDRVVADKKHATRQRRIIQSRSRETFT